MHIVIHLHISSKIIRLVWQIFAMTWYKYMDQKIIYIAKVHRPRGYSYGKRVWTVRTFIGSSTCTERSHTWYNLYSEGSRTTTCYHKILGRCLSCYITTKKIKWVLKINTWTNIAHTHLHKLSKDYNYTYTEKMSYFMNEMTVLFCTTDLLCFFLD